MFNCDETDLYYRLLPQKTLASVFETRADGWKRAKDRVTISVCANITGSIKLLLLFIGKYDHPKCFSNINLDALQVTYMNQKSAWVNAHIFSTWFNTIFTRFVQEKLKGMDLQPKALFVLDNCSAHPDESQIVSDEGLIVSKFLPTNVTSLIQPMDQGVLKSMKQDTVPHYCESFFCLKTKISLHF